LVSELDSVCILQIGKARKKISAMQPRIRVRQTPNLLEDREMPRGRDRQVPNLAMEREMRDIHARLVDMETAQRHTIGVGYVSDSESEDEAGHEGKEVVAEDAANERLIRAVARMCAKEKMDILVYEGNLDVEASRLD
jgi:hypothetical protein